MTFEEEDRLLAACNNNMRRHLRPILIAAVDTGMRMGELLKLKWRNVDLNARFIEIEAFNTKTARAQTVAMTSRLTAELKHIWVNTRQDPEGLVFGIKDNIKNGFNSACESSSGA